MYASSVAALLTDRNRIGVLKRWDRQTDTRPQLYAILYRRISQRNNQ